MGTGLGPPAETHPRLDQGLPLPVRRVGLAWASPETVEAFW